MQSNIPLDVIKIIIGFMRPEYWRTCRLVDRQWCNHVDSCLLQQTLLIVTERHLPRLEDFPRATGICIRLYNEKSCSLRDLPQRIERVECQVGDIDEWPRHLRAIQTESSETISPRALQNVRRLSGRRIKATQDLSMAAELREVCLSNVSLATLPRPDVLTHLTYTIGRDHHFDVRPMCNLVHLSTLR